MAKKHYEWRIGESPPRLGAHSKAKHDLMEAYLRRYVEICTATPVQDKLNLTIVDGFSGGGRYRYAGSEVPGSPLIMLNAISDLQDKINRARPKGFEIATDFVFIDSRKAHTEYLRAELESSPYASMLDKTVHVWSGNFEDRADDAIVLAQRRSPQRGRSLFFLDQYGWNSVTFETVRRIIRTLEKAEIFLTFAVDSLIDYLNDNRNEAGAYAKIDLDRGKIRELLTIKDEERGWRTIIQNTLYKHLRSQTGAEFYSPFFIRSSEAHRTYWLVHLSRHREARNEIGRIHWKFHNQSLHHGRPGLNALGFAGHADTEQMVFGYEFDHTARLHSLNALRDQIPRFIDAAGGADVAPSLEELFGMRCNDTPVTRDIFEEVLINLRDHGEVRIEDAFGVGKPRSQSLGWTDRIILSQQRSFFGPLGLIGSRS